MNYQSANSYSKKVKRLSQLYDLVMYALGELREDLIQQLVDHDLSWSQSLKSKYGFVQHHSPKLVVQETHVKKGLFPRTLRAFLLVRLVSDFELFLVDLIREVARRDLTPFRRDTRVEIPRGLLLGFSSVTTLQNYIVEKDCRSLTSSGFDEIYKYYKKYLDIDMCDSDYPLKTLQEIHVRRHLHVHRGGRTDAKYQRDFDSSIGLNVPLMVSEDYLRTTIDTFQDVAKYLDQDANKKFPEKIYEQIRGDRTEVNIGDYLYYVKARFPSSSSASDHFTLDDIHSDQIVTLRDILVVANLDGKNAEWTVAGKKDEVGTYIGRLYQLNKADYFDHFDCRRLIKGHETKNL